MTYQGIYGTYPKNQAKFTLMTTRNDPDCPGIPMETFEPPNEQYMQNNQNELQSQLLYSDYESYSAPKPLLVASNHKPKEIHWKNIFENITRPCVAELFSVTLSIFIYLHTESQLLQRHVTFLQKIIMLSVVDSIVYTVFFSAFQTVHINPAITIAQLFTITTKWYLCFLFLIMQFFGVILGSTGFYLASNHFLPSKPTVIQDLTQDWTVGAYSMVVCQVIGTTMVVMSNLLVIKNCRLSKIYWRRMSRSPIALAGAVGLASLLSLFHSNISWNPLHVLVLEILQFFHRHTIQFSLTDYIFFLGSTIGALFGSITFKLLFASSLENQQVTLITN